MLSFTKTNILFLLLEAVYTLFSKHMHQRFGVFFIRNTLNLETTQYFESICIFKVVITVTLYFCHIWSTLDRILITCDLGIFHLESEGLDQCKYGVTEITPLSTSFCVKTKNLTNWEGR